MKKIAALHAYLQALNLVNAEKLDSWIEDMQIIPGGEQAHYCLADDSFILCRQNYTAQFEFDDFPHADINPALVFAHVSAWLISNDNQRETMDFAVNVDIYDAKTALIQVGIQFYEDVFVTPDQGSDIELSGSFYRLVE